MKVRLRYAATALTVAVLAACSTDDEARFAQLPDAAKKNAESKPEQRPATAPSPRTVTGGTGTPVSDTPSATVAAGPHQAPVPTSPVEASTAEVVVKDEPSNAAVHTSPAVAIVPATPPSVTAGTEEAGLGGGMTDDDTSGKTAPANDASDGRTDTGVSGADDASAALPPAAADNANPNPVTIFAALFEEDWKLYYAYPDPNRVFPYFVVVTGDVDGLQKTFCGSPAAEESAAALDLQGSAAATLTAPIALAAAPANLSIRVRGSCRPSYSETDAMTVTILDEQGATLFQQRIQLRYDAPWQTVAATFSAGAPTNAKLVIQAEGPNDMTGLLLGNVIVTQ